MDSIVLYYEITKTKRGQTRTERLVIMGKFDEILDDVVLNAKTAATAVSKKAAIVYDASKHKITAAEIRGEINKKLKELGKFTYKSRVYNTDMNEQIDAAIAEIKELKENLEIINAHIDELKNQKKCPQCEARIPKNSVYCNICGAKLDEAEEVINAADVAEEAAEEAEAETVAEAAAETVAEAEPAPAEEAAE